MNCCACMCFSSTYLFRVRPSVNGCNLDKVGLQKWLGWAKDGYKPQRHNHEGKWLRREEPRGPIQRSLWRMGKHSPQSECHHLAHPRTILLHTKSSRPYYECGDRQNKGLSP
eukprot:3767579-Amphidinium_carterae.1